MGVTVLQAAAEMDAGDVWASVPCGRRCRVGVGAVWASVPCALPPRGKSDLYRNEICDAAVEAVLLAVKRFASGDYVPRPQREAGLEGTARTRPYFGQSLRRIDWASEPGDAVLRKLRAADSQPGVLDEFLGAEWYLHGGCEEDVLRGRPGEVLATRAGAICRATVDGAVWIPELRPRRRPGGPATFKVPAALALGERMPAVPEAPVPLYLPKRRWTWTDIRYREVGPVGFLWFSFPGGAMSTSQCRRLLAAYRFARSRPALVLVLGSQRDFFSNGIHLGAIEATADPAEESWANITAMDDLVEAVLTTGERLVVVALGGNAAAGGAMLALAADEVWCRSRVVLNPHYRLMGLHGSEYWTYTLPRGIGDAEAARLMQRALPVTAAKALDLGLVDRAIPCAVQDFATHVTRLAARIATAPRLQRRIGEKKAVRERDEAAKPLRAYRAEELAHMRRTFFDPGTPYHALRRAFVRKEPPRRTPPHLRSAGPRHGSRDGMPGPAADGGS